MSLAACIRAARLPGALHSFAFACLALFVGCEEPLPTVVELSREETAGTFGFAVSTDFDCRRHIEISIECAELIRPIPTVSVGDTALAPAAVSGYYGLSWSWAETGPASRIGYQIAWQGDELTDSFTIPYGVDSLFCGGYRLSVDTIGLEGLVQSRDTIPVNDVYRFRWYCQGAPYYSVSVSYEYVLRDTAAWGFETVHMILRADSLNLPVAHDSGDVKYASIRVTTCLDSGTDWSTGRAGVRSGQLHAYRSIEGGTYRANVRRLEH
jgi:hypothetical protein